jgi:hypothetical protein
VANDDKARINKMSSDGNDELDWSSVTPGVQVTIIKLAPDGSEAARYPGEVVAVVGAEPWAVVRAVWTFRQVDVDGLVFCPGDVLLEWFSPRHPFNAFALFSPDLTFKGWYANVTWPTRLNPLASPPLLIWHDLYLDLVAPPNETAKLLDEDELAASGLQDDDPDLHHRVVAAGGELERRLREGILPFAASVLMRRMLEPPSVRE